MEKEIRVRFAPSPTGAMHIGNLRTAIFNYLYGKKNKGKMFIRIEDTDIGRSKKEYEDMIFYILKWIGIEYEEKILKQSERFHIYQKIAYELKEKNITYFCKCEDLSQETDTCPCFEKKFNEGVMRFNVPKNRIMTLNDVILGEVKVNTDTIENFALLRSDGAPTYNFVVVVDDLEMNISHVFRGGDHLYNTFKQLLVYEALGKEPPLFGHFPMINGEDGKKLSKRLGNTSVKHYIDIGIPAPALFNFLIRLGWGYGNQEIFSKEEAIELFNISKISKSPAIFNENKLMYLSGFYLSRDCELYLHECIKKIEEKIKRNVKEEEKQQIKKLLKEFSKRSKTINELSESFLFLFETINFDTNVIDKNLLNRIIEVLKQIKEEEWIEEEISKQLKTNFQNEMKEICFIIRTILLNTPVSPSLFLILEVLGKENGIKKLQLKI